MALHSRIVTAHALLRYLERVEGHDLPALRAAARRDGVDPAHEGPLVNWLRRNTDIDIHGATARLSGPTVRMALEVGAKSVRLSGLVVVLGQGRVVTIKSDVKRRLRPTRYRAERRVPGPRDRRHEMEHAQE